jgi:CRISPR-associated protein Csb3
MTPTATSNVLTLERSDPLELLTHMAAYGFAAIVEGTTPPPPTLFWTSGMEPRLSIEHESLDAQGMAQCVLNHAKQLSDTNAWPHETWTTKRPKSDLQQGLMSPRITKIEPQERWKDLQRRRHEVLDALVKADAWLDLRFLWSLGEPCYWRNAKDSDQDTAASRLDLQRRNGGADIVGTRIAPLAPLVSERRPEEVVNAFCGADPKDTIGEDKGSDSLSAVGFRGRGPVDDAVSWCAIWGISQFALNQTLASDQTRVDATTASCMMLRKKLRKQEEWVCVPVWRGQWTPARLRTILASRQLRATAWTYLSADDTDGSGDVVGSTGANWLLARGVHALILFPFKVDVSDRAKPRYAQRGVICDLRRPRGDIWAATSR